MCKPRIFGNPTFPVNSRVQPAAKAPSMSSGAFLLNGTFSLARWKGYRVTGALVSFWQWKCSFVNRWAHHEFAKTEAWLIPWSQWWLLVMLSFYLIWWYMVATHGDPLLYANFATLLQRAVASSFRNPMSISQWTLEQCKRLSEIENLSVASTYFKIISH